MAKQHTMTGWPDYAGMFDDALPYTPYTIVIGRGVAAQKSVREFPCDGGAIRWAGTSLAYRRERVRVYRGRQPRGKPLMEIRASM